MIDDLGRQLERWQAAEAAGHEEEADAACLTVFAGGEREPAVPAAFTARTVAAIAAAREHDHRTARRFRRTTIGGAVAAAAVVVYALGPWLLSGLSSILTGSINLLVTFSITVASVLQAGGDVWSILAALGRAAGAFAADPKVTLAIVAMQGIAIAALIALQRLLGSDREPSK